MWNQHETPEQAEAAQAEQSKLRKRRARDAEHARLVEDREAVRHHAMKAKEHFGTNAGADHAATAFALSERIAPRFDVGGYDVGAGPAIAGGELAPVEDRSADGSFYAPTLPFDVSQMLGDDDLLRRSASRDRIDALVQADALALGVECAESVGAENAVEKMLAHEAAAAHTLGMKFASRAAEMLEGITGWQDECRQQVQSIEACRLANTSARLMKATAEAAEALHKLRGGSPQQIVVTHVHQAVQVNDGGQAVVNGAIQGKALPGGATER